VNPDRRAEILDAAATLILERGYTLTSVHDVIRGAGLSGKSQFYHYFPSKEALGYEVLDRQFAWFESHGLTVLRTPGVPPLERLNEFIDALVTIHSSRECRTGCPFGNLAGELSQAHEGFRARIEVVFERWATQLQALFWEARMELVQHADAARLARFVVATLEGAILMSRVKRDPESLEEIAADLKRFISMHVRGRMPAVVSRAGAVIQQ